MTVAMSPFAVTEAPVRHAENREFGDVGPGECFCVRFHGDMTMLASSHADGTIQVHDPVATVPSSCSDVETAPLLCSVDTRSKLPTTAVRFRPGLRSKKSQSNVLVSVGAVGMVQHWHLGSQKCLHTVAEEAVHRLTKQQYQNQIFAMEYDRTGKLFATAGKDYRVRVYDEATKSCFTTLQQSLMGTAPGHSNCVFSVKFHPTDQNVLLSAGWDNTVCIWDLRVGGGAVRSIFGPHICGDALDIHPESGQTILTGSYRPQDQLQIWDYGSAALVNTLDWPGPGQAQPGKMTMLYAAQFSMDGKHLAAGGAGRNEVRVYDVKNGKSLGAALLPGGCYCIDWAPNCDSFAVGLSDGSCQLYRSPSG